MDSDIGRAITTLDTPALIVDLDAMDRNIARIANYLEEQRVAWRPHMKGAKLPAIGHILQKAGAIGVTCAKVSEAEVMAAGGISSILISSEIAGDQKISRLANLARRAEIIVCVDNLINARALGQAALEADTVLQVLVEVDIGLKRCGINPKDAVSFAVEVSRLPGVRFSGLMGWEGHLAEIPPTEEKRQLCQEAVGLVTHAAAACREVGLPVDIVSCGGTGTYQYSACVKGVTEIQAGGGIFGDIAYRRWGVDSECALTVLATVISRPTPTRVVVDAGRKAMQREIAYPEPKNVEAASQLRLSAEHAAFELKQPNERPKVGDKIEFEVGYSDTTICLHDSLVGTRKSFIEVVWPILGRGMLQ